MKLVELGRAFIRGEITVEGFVEDIVVERRKLYGVFEPDKAVDQCGGDLFIIADCYNPYSDRDDYELDEYGLRKEVKETLEKYNLL
ncbi:colicin-D [Salmonella enterica]|nr:colicin-D [Salmonella enterica]ELX2843914.1 colicin-D [Salmonella enterica]